MLKARDMQCTYAARSFSRLCAHDAVIVNVSAPCYLCCACLVYNRVLIALKFSLRSIYRIERNFESRRNLARLIGPQNGAVSSIIYDVLLRLCYIHEIYVSLSHIVL